MTRGVCLSGLSVRLSVCMSNSRTENLGSPKLAEWTSILRAIREHTYISKGQRSRPPGRLMLSQTMHHTQVVSIVPGNFVKISLLLLPLICSIVTIAIPSQHVRSSSLWSRTACSRLNCCCCKKSVNTFLFAIVLAYAVH